MNQFTLFLLIHTFLGVAGDPQITHDLSTPSSSKTITDRFDPTLLPNEPLIHPTVNERQLTEGRQLGGTQFIHARTTGKCEKMAITAVGAFGFQQGVDTNKFYATTTVATCTKLHSIIGGAAGASELAYGGVPPKEKWKTNGAHNHCNDPRYYGIGSPTGNRDRSVCLTQGNNGWLQLDLGAVKTVFSVVTTGRTVASQYVTKYTITVSNDGTTFTNAPCVQKDSNGYCNGNADHSTEKTNILAGSITARFVRLNVKAKNEYASLRMGVSVSWAAQTAEAKNKKEIFGCFLENAKLKVSTDEKHDKNCGQDKYKKCFCLQPCNTGTYGSYDHKDCQSCVAGRYSDKTGLVKSTNALPCAICPKGKWQDTAGSTSCKDCPTGRWQKTLGHTAACTPCPVGTFKNSEGSDSECTSCPKGYVQPDAAQSDCKECDAGKVQENQKKTECKLCAKGRFEDGKDKDCAKCAKGKHQPDEGKTECIDCLAGFYNSRKGQPSCQSCDKGRYRAAAGAHMSSLCLECAKGQHNNEKGQSSCADCPKGKVTTKPAQLDCEVCAIAKYQIAAGESSCDECPIGRYNDDVLSNPLLHDALEDCTKCITGKSQDKAGQSICNDCPKGRYNDAEMANECKQCDIKKSNPLKGSKIESACALCIAGQYNSEKGQENCKRCNAGLWANEVGEEKQDHCKSCEAGTFTATAGATSCTDCPEATYLSEKLIVRSYPRIKCLSCPAAKGTKNIECDGCGAGQYGDDTDGGCADCAIGFFAPGGNIAACLSCPAGFHGRNTAAASNCDSCIVGKWSDSVGASSSNAQQWTLVITAQAITENVGVTVTQGASSGTLKTALIGDSTHVVITTTADSITFSSSTCQVKTDGTNEECAAAKTEAACATATTDGGGNNAANACVFSGTDVVVGGTTILHANVLSASICTAACDESTCVACAKGKFSNTEDATVGTVCIDCAQGKFSLTLAAGHPSYCLDCDAGQYSGDVGRATECTDCWPGKFSSFAGAKVPCEDCPQGWNLPADVVKKSMCSMCLPGTAQISTGATTCSECDPGKISDVPKSATCHNCEAGTYQKENGRSSCLPCIPGRTSTSAGSTSCSICDLGKYMVEIGATAPCKNCPAGWAQGSANQPTCQECSPGTYADVVELSSCKVCDPNTYSANAGSTTCLACPDGETSLIKSAGCTLCPAGKAAKTFKLVDDPDVACEICGLGEYRGVSDSATTCLECPLGRTTADATGSTACSVCTAGMYGSEINVCTVCAFGQYRKGGDNKDTNATTCIKCPAGYHQDEPGQASCLPCSPGQAQNDEGSKDCTLCAVNTFSDVIKLSSCKPCDVGRTTNEKLGAADCQDCRAGRYGDVCSDCVSGQFRSADDEDPTQCDLCLPGFYSEDTGLASCLPCSPGRVAPLAGASTCDYCVVGQFQEGTNKLTCKNCDLGLGTSLNGSAICNLCAKGKASNADTKHECIECEINYFADKEQSKSCDKCALGTDTGGATGSIQCKVPPVDDNMIAPTHVTLTANDLFSVEVHWQHGDIHQRRLNGGDEVPQAFGIRWSTSREFTDGPKNEGFYATQVLGSNIRSASITIDPNTELWLLDHEVFIQVNALILGNPEKGTLTKKSKYSIPTEPWKLAEMCGDDEFLNNSLLNSTMLNPNVWKCNDCPDGAACRGSTVWSDVRVLHGNWRVPWQTNEFKRCPFINDCLGAQPENGRRRKFGMNGTESNRSASDGCIHGTQGVLCSQCIEGFTRDAATCTECAAEDMGLRVGILIVVMILVIVLFLALKRKLKTAWRKYRSLYRDFLRIGSIFVTFSQINTSIPSIIEVPWPQNFVGFVSNFNVVNIDVFALIGVNCIGNFDFYMSFIAMCGLPTVIAVWTLFTLWYSTKRMNRKVKLMSPGDKDLMCEESYHMLYHFTDDDGGGEVSPKEFSSLLLNLGWEVETHEAEELILLLSGCENAHDDKSHYRDTQGRVCLKENVFVDHMVQGDLKTCIEKMDEEEGDKDGVDFVGKTSNDLLHNKDHLVKWVLKKGIVSRTMAGATSLLLLAHTPVSRKVFQYFHCSEMGGKSFMRADYSIECLSAPWFAFLPVVLVVLCTFTIALPGYIGYYLWVHRKQLYSASIQQRVGWLYDPYRKGAEFWQVHDVVLKMILTGMLIYVPPPYRASVATLLTVISIANLNYFTPHKNKTLFWLTQVSFIITCFKYLTAMMIGAAYAVGDKESATYFGIGLIGLDCLFMCFAVVVVFATFKIVRTKLKKMKGVKAKLKNAVKTNSAKMKSKTWLSSLQKKVTKKDGGGGDGGGKSSTKVVPYSEGKQKQVYNL